MEESSLLSLYRRSYNRCKVNSSATLVINDIAQSSILRDISIKGAGLVTRYPVNVGEDLNLIIHPPIFDNPVKRKGKICWCKKLEDNLWRAGLEFQ